MKKDKSLIQQRLGVFMDLYKKGSEALPELEDLYYLLGGDLGLYNDLRRDLVRKIRAKKQYLQNNRVYKSIAEFDRDFEMSDEYILDKEYKFAIRALEKMMMAVGLRIKALKAELGGQY